MWPFEGWPLSPDTDILIHGWPLLFIWASLIAGRDLPTIYLNFNCPIMGTLVGEASLVDQDRQASSAVCWLPLKANSTWHFQCSRQKSKLSLSFMLNCTLSFSDLVSSPCTLTDLHVVPNNCRIQRRKEFANKQIGFIWRFCLPHSKAPQLRVGKASGGIHQGLG